VECERSLSTLSHVILDIRIYRIGWFMVNRDNVVTTETAAPRKKAPVKKAAVKKEVIPVDGDNDGLVDDGKETERSVKLAAVSSDTESLVIYFESGIGYTTGTGIRFTRESPMREVSFAEANLLLRLSNFRLANDEEKEMYYNNLEG